jgi:hypothetical protein
MSSYDDRLKSLREAAHDAEEAIRDLAPDDWPSEETRARTLGVFAYARIILETTDPELLSDQAFQQVSTRSRSSQAIQRQARQTRTRGPRRFWMRLRSFQRREIERLSRRSRTPLRTSSVQRSSG